MPSNTYFLATIRFDIAENEPAKILQILQNVTNFASEAEAAGDAARLGPLRRGGLAARRAYAYTTTSVRRSKVERPQFMTILSHVCEACT